MTPAQWARVFHAGSDAIMRARAKTTVGTGTLAGLAPDVALLLALEAMRKESTTIAEETE